MYPRTYSKSYCLNSSKNKGYSTNNHCSHSLFWKIMRLSAFFFLIGVLHVSARTSAQKISIKTKNTPIKTVFREIEQQSGYFFLFDPAILKSVKNIDAKAENLSLEQALDKCLAGTGLRYEIVKKNIVITKNEITADKFNNVFQAAALPDRQIHVKVTDSTGAPLEGASIAVRDAKQHGQTDKSGDAMLSNVGNNIIIVVSYVGYQTKEVIVNDNTDNVTVVLSPRDNSLNEVVMIGYGSEKKVSLTGSVQTIAGKDVKNRAVPNVVDALEGMAPGLYIQQTDANPGYSNTQVQIRGTSTLSNNPVLYIVDGMPVTNLQYLNPADIASISVLKDASATAIYGARASGGVLLVTTKKGSANSKPVLQYSNMIGTQRPARLPKFVGAGQYVDLYNQAQLNDNPGATVKFTPQMVDDYKSGKLPSTDWLPYIMGRTALQQQHTLSVSGGSNAADYYVSGGYLDQQGIIKNVDYKRYSVKTNVNVHVSSRLKLGVNSQLTKEDKTQPAYGVNTALQWSYIVPVTEFPYTKGGHDRSYRGGQQPNDIMTKGGIQNETVNTINTSFLAEFSILKNLVLNGTYGYNYTQDFTSYFAPTYPLYNDNEQIVVYANNPNNTYKANWSQSHPTTTLTLNYNTAIKQHKIKALLGYSQEQDRYDFNSITRYGFLTNSIDQVDAGSSDPTLTNVSGNATSYAIRSYFGRLNYDFAGKYLLEASARYDGTSVFLNKRYGLFPSVSGGWIVSNESFFKKVANTITFLKIRGSFGQVGNQNASGLYPYANTVAQGTYVLNKAPITTTYYNNSPNPDLTWETKTSANLGVDITLFNNLEITADLYHEKTTGILRSPTVPSSFGIGAPQQNVGKMSNKGFEINISYKNNIRDLNYRVSFNLADDRNKILDLGGTGPSYGDNPLIVGQSRWVWYGLKAEGLFQSKDDIANHATQNPRNIPGDIKFKDVNGDGKITPDDRVLLGQATPHYRYGFRLSADYKGFDIQMLFQGVFSNLARVTGGAQVPFFFNGDGNILQSQLDYWSPSNTNARYPVLRTDQSINNAQFSSWWLFKAAYLRFKNVQLGYTFNSQQLKRLGVSSLRAFVAADNLYTITSKYFPKSLDPEIPNYGDGSNYPQVRNISVGLNLSF